MEVKVKNKKTAMNNMKNQRKIVYVCGSASAALRQQNKREREKQKTNIESRKFSGCLRTKHYSAYTQTHAHNKREKSQQVKIRCVYVCAL